MAALRAPQLWGWGQPPRSSLRGPPRVATPDFSMSFSASHPPPGLNLLRAPRAALLPATRTHACCRQTLHGTGVGKQSVWSRGLRPALSLQTGAASVPRCCCAQRCIDPALPSKAAPTSGVRSEAGGARPASLGVNVSEFKRVLQAAFLLMCEEASPPGRVQSRRHVHISKGCQVHARPCRLGCPGTVGKPAALLVASPCRSQSPTQRSVAALLLLEWAGPSGP